ncbi:MAG: formamidopyrimidine DNA glycosylase [Gemmatimonadota bacterium]|nr:formamidopyrimidine DNA glycosylase [Gemmatimonadota bacterium]
MPEGDTIHRLAHRMGKDLVGRTLTALSVQGVGVVPELAGASVEGVEARGKHLLVHFEPGWSLRVHLGMKGRWRRTPAVPGRGRYAASPASVQITAGPVAWTCAGAYQAELIRTRHLSTHPRLSRLGPDLLAPSPDIAAMVRRASFPGYRHRAVATCIMDQTVASGLGNVYKSEVLFLEGIHPALPVHALAEGALAKVFDTAHRLMRDSVSRRRRETVPLVLRPSPNSPRLWVYRREGDPCLRCRRAVVRIVQEGRSTYFCPSCQPEDPPQADRKKE